uniref:PH domain-containing protein n=1 Tax=Syphacia muris TaxID=451379 RepID=A0A0N5AXK4_9BILA
MAAAERSSPAQFVKEEYIEKLNAEDSPVCTNWDPRLLIDKLYEVSYNPRIESKINRFTNMEGHLEVPVNENDIIAELQKKWVKKYFRTKEGRLQWFATHFANDSPVGEVLLSGCDIEAKKDEGLLIIHGGKANVRMILKVPVPNNVFDKWRKALNSHAGSSYMDAFMQPISPIAPLSRVIIIELGSCSIRAGVLTKEPSLPQCFFPSIAVKKDDKSVVVGKAALAPENRHNGELVRPIQPTDPAFERFILHEEVLKACIQKCIDQLHVDPAKYLTLLTIPQSIPTVLIGDILKILLNGFDFQGAAISTHPSLILHAYDVTTGVVVDIGDRLNIIPVVDGYVVENAVISLPYGALQIANALQAKLAESNMSPYNFKSPVERLLLRYVMEQVKFFNMTVSLDEFQPLTEMTNTFKVNSARFTATEGLFKPKRWNLDTKALHELVHESIQLSPIDSRKILLRNIYLAGGTSLLPGLAERLEAEISSLVAPTIFTQVHVSPWRYHAAYLGAQAVASSVQFEDKCITRETLQPFLIKLQKSTF